MISKKSNLQKRKDNPNSLYWQRKTLKLWTDICRIKFNNECLICKSKEHLECHHPISKKTCKSLMYNITNQILLCSKHHNWFGTEDYLFSAHKNPLQFYHYLQEHHKELYEEILQIDIEQEKQGSKTTKDYFDELTKIKEEFLF